MEKRIPQGDPLVTIRCTVYNHEPFLRQCLDGFVMQETTFPFEAIVHDDASTDGSAAIIREYAERYPDIIKPIYETENQYSKNDGSLKRVMESAMNPASKYIAYCEGDDYWTDPNKLQLQVDFLESHPDFFMSCHGFTYFYEDTKSFERQKSLDFLPNDYFKGREYCTPTIENFFNSRWFTQILTLVRRKEKYIGDEVLSNYSHPYDYITCYYMLKSGKCALFKDVMGVYRKQNNGVYSGRNDEKWKEETLRNYLVLFRLEKEKLVLPIIDNLFIDTFVLKIKKSGMMETIKYLSDYIKNVPIKNSSKMMARLFSHSLLSMINRIFPKKR